MSRCLMVFSSSAGAPPAETGPASNRRQTAHRPAARHGRHGVEPGCFNTIRRDRFSMPNRGFVKPCPENHASRSRAIRRRMRGRGVEAVAKLPHRRYIWQRRSALLDRSNIPRGLIDPKGAVPGRTRGFGHTAPTYFVGTRDRPLHRPSRIATCSRVRLAGFARPCRFCNLLPMFRA